MRDMIVSRDVVPAIVLIVAIPGALINDMLDGARPLSLVLWLVAGLTILLVLTRAYIVAAGIDRLATATDPGYTVRAHILLQVVPLSYFPLASAVDASRVLETAYLVPVLAFFLTGVRTWTLCHRLFATKLYKMFQIGNRQMLVVFPLAFAVDMAGWPIEQAEIFSRLMHVYFIVHFILTGITVPLMGKDLERYVNSSP